MSEENRRQLISDGIAFMRSISDQYGTETGLQLWDRICEVLDPNVKGEIFIAMLTGDTRAKLTISCSPHQYPTYRILHIKAIRELAEHYKPRKLPDIGRPKMWLSGLEDLIVDVQHCV